MIRRAHGALASAILLGLGAASATHAQLIPIRTVPVASGDQFLLMPSTSLGMGGVRYAVEDSVADAWGNPALGRSIGSSAFFGSPTFYGISRNGGGGRSFPLGAVFNGTTWFGGASVALQQIENADGDDPRFLVEPTSFVCCPTEQALSDRFGRNLYASGFVGRRLGDDWSVGVGASAAELGAMDGVDLLYAGAARIAQDGAIAEIRAGAVREVGQDRLALVVAHHRVSMYHDVTYFDGGVPGGRRVEANADESRTWAGQLAWDRSLTAPDGG